MSQKSSYHSQRGIRDDRWESKCFTIALPSGLILIADIFSRAYWIISSFIVFFQTLNSISAEKNSTIIFPVPLGGTPLQHFEIPLFGFSMHDFQTCCATWLAGESHNGVGKKQRVIWADASVYCPPTVARRGPMFCPGRGRSSGQKSTWIKIFTTYTHSDVQWSKMKGINAYQNISRCN